MKASNCKAFWWTLLAFTAGVPILGTIAMVTGRLHPWTQESVVTWILINAALVMLSIVMLVRCYSQRPSHWIGHWQLSLGDLLLIAFLFGGAMTVFRSAWPASFLRLGVPLSVTICVAYTVALLFASRMWRVDSMRRWIHAFSLVAEATLTVLGGFVLQGVIVALLFLINTHIR